MRYRRFSHRRTPSNLKRKLSKNKFATIAIRPTTRRAIPIRSTTRRFSSSSNIGISFISIRRERNWQTTSRLSIRVCWQPISPATIRSASRCPPHVGQDQIPAAVAHVRASAHQRERVLQQRRLRRTRIPDLHCSDRRARRPTITGGSDIISGSEDWTAAPMRPARRRMNTRNATTTAPTRFFNRPNIASVSIAIRIMF